jgi:hypothetical protein
LACDDDGRTIVAIVIRAFQDHDYAHYVGIVRRTQKVPGRTEYGPPLNGAGVGDDAGLCIVAVADTGQVTGWGTVRAASPGAGDSGGSNREPGSSRTGAWTLDVRVDSRVEEYPCGNER